MERSLSTQDFSSPVWIDSALTYLRSDGNKDRYGGPPELGYKVHRREAFARDLRMDWDFITVPSLESKNEVIVEHGLPIGKLYFWQKRDDGGRDEVKPEEGEKWVIGPSEGGLGTFWWTWGSMEGDLKGKEFRNDEWFEEEKDGGKKGTGRERMGLYRRRQRIWAHYGDTKPYWDDNCIAVPLFVHTNNHTSCSSARFVAENGQGA